MSCNNSGAVDPHILSPPPTSTSPFRTWSSAGPFPVLCDYIFSQRTPPVTAPLWTVQYVRRPRILRPPFFAIIIIICHILIFNRIVTFNLHRLLARLPCFLVHTFDEGDCLSLYPLLATPSTWAPFCCCCCGLLVPSTFINIVASCRCLLMNPKRGAQTTHSSSPARHRDSTFCSSARAK